MLRRTLLWAAGLCSVLPAATRAEPAVRPADYAALAVELDARIGFEALPRRAEPGWNLDTRVRAGRAWLGERFAGQPLNEADGFDRVSGRPDAPLRPVAGAAGENLSIAFHRGFGSNALFPLGPARFPAREARGEGAVAILFDQSQRAVGLKVHSDYADPLGGRDARPGAVEFILFTRQGARIARISRPLRTGVTAIGLRRAGGVPDIAGVLILNSDPGGIAIDDVLYRTAPLAS